MDLLQRAREYLEYTVRVRRHFHEYPEAGPAEQLQTLAFIENELEAMHIPYLRIAGGGLLGFLAKEKPGKTVLLRTDTDALPIRESERNLVKEKDCVSKIEGVSHACGHDAHMAMLLTEARILKEMEDQLQGPVILMFEEGEEGYTNGIRLLEYLQKEQVRIDTVYGAHVHWNTPTGKVVCCRGGAMSGLYHFKLKLHGLAGHGSRPDLGHSTIGCFCEIHQAMQRLRMNCVSPYTPLTWSFGSVHAGSTFNVVPDQLESMGSIRYFDRESGHRFWTEMKHTVKEICELHRCDYRLELLECLLPVINNDDCREIYLNGVRKHLGEDALEEREAWMASESFSRFMAMYPGVFSYVGIQNPELGSGANHHSPEFDLDENGLPYGVAAAVAYVLEFQKMNITPSDYEPICHSMEELLEISENG